MNFQQRLEKLGYKSYQDYLKSEYWQDLQKRYFNSKLPQFCLICKSSNFQLHHRTYKRLSREWLMDLIPLCHNCHYTFHKNKKGRIRFLWYKTRNYVKKKAI